MARVVKGALIQCANNTPTEKPVAEIKKNMIDLHVKLCHDAKAKGAQVTCLQEIFYGPYFCAEQDIKWYESAEPMPDEATDNPDPAKYPTTAQFCDLAKETGMVIVLPIYEHTFTGVYYNTAGVIDADGKYLGKYRKIHIPHCHPGFWEKFYFKPGNLGYPVFETAVGRVGVYICYDRHFPDGARIFGLHGAEILFNPSATVAGLSEYLWKLEQPAHAVANQYFVGAINRVGKEGPWNIGEFYGQSYFCDPRGQMISVGSRNEDDIVIADMDLDLILEVRNTWQFFRDRRPDTYGPLVEQLP